MHRPRVNNPGFPTRPETMSTGHPADTEKSGDKPGPRVEGAVAFRAGAAGVGHAYAQVRLPDAIRRVSPALVTFAAVNAAPMRKFPADSASHIPA